MRLLLVEDEPELQEITAKRLKAEGYTMDVCGDGVSEIGRASCRERV